ncbi:hypothetical protein PanWU01x14_115830 [Parasponia andersonii]|uniref:Uncharacterized protein n=1 Tax=Parasponia andersonii TaxID=3476 RepID=A0A2P5CX29_PARAD|nr:hypothetical protein PanWU01x14_115830 [Parasponia andersonii]
MAATLIPKYQDSSVSYDEFLESYRLFGCFGLLRNGGQVYGVFVCRAKSRFSCEGVIKIFFLLHIKLVQERSDVWYSLFSLQICRRIGYACSCVLWRVKRNLVSLSFCGTLVSEFKGFDFPPWLLFMLII